MENKLEKIGVVVIGRNEGERLKSCLQSILSQVDKVVYVDSGSSDGSVEYAAEKGVYIVQLNMVTPFSAGRARNEGLECLINKFDSIQYVQFIDGDCQMENGWLSFAIKALDANPSFAVVAGRRKEIHPESSIYNLLCDIEWNTPVGESNSCGGDFLVKTEVFMGVGGFNPSVIAGEEPELCYRLRKAGWSIYRLNHPMTLHDAAIKRLSQWWYRSLRTGHAYAQGYWLHRKDKEGYCLKQSLRIWFWAFVFPCTVLWFGIAFSFWLLSLFLLVFVQMMKTALNIQKRLDNWESAMKYSFFTYCGKFPQLFGQLLFIKRKVWGNSYTIIEYR